MATENLDQNTDQNTQDDIALTQENKADNDLLSKLVKEGIEEALKPIKTNLDKAYGERDRYKDQLEKIEKEKREAELKRLEEEGKHKEVYEARLQEEREARQKLEKENIELTRNMEVRSSLSTLQFRNANALEMAQKEIVGQLVRNEQGAWVHRSGISIQDFVKAFSDSDENAFLFKVKVSSGGGSTSSTNVPTGDVKKKSLFEMSQEEVIKLAQEGKLRKA